MYSPQGNGPGDRTNSPDVILVHLAGKHPQIYVLGYYLFLEVFFDLQHSRKTVHFSERIMSADKYSSLFPRQMEAIDYLVYCG